MSETMDSATIASALLPAALHFDPGNLATNKRLWNEYATSWSPKEPWVRELAKEAGNDRELRYVGDEWSSASELQEVLDSFVIPYLDSRSVVADVGCGGGRVASKVSFSTRRA